jgi:hypothetical protein
MYRHRSQTYQTKKWQTRPRHANLPRLRTPASPPKKSPTSNLNQNNPRRKRKHQNQQHPHQNPPLRNQTPCRKQTLPRKASAVSQRFPGNVVLAVRPRIVLQTGMRRTAVRRRQRIQAHRRSDDEVALRLVVEDGRATGARRMSRRFRSTRKET